MTDSKSVIELAGYSFWFLGIIATAHFLLDRFLGYSLFSVFITTAPSLMKSIVPSEPFYFWLEGRIQNKSVHEMWDICLIYLFLLTSVLFLFSGCWIFLILKLFSVINTPIIVIIFWFIINFIIFFISSSNQTALTFHIRDRRIKRTETIRNRMRENQLLTLKIFLKYFSTNWILAPYNTLKILLIDILAILLFWPAWLIQALHVHPKIDLNDDKTRTTYFIGYAFTSILLGQSLMFFFS